MKTFDVTFSNGLRFGLFMYCADTAPSHAGICAALRRRGISESTIARLTWSVAVMKYDFGGGRIATGERKR
jgi:hypothetical protein